MRLILTILLIGLFKADAQMVINASAPYRPFVVANNLLLDSFSNAAAAYSLRKLDKDYTGAAIRVRKDTTGQPEQDINFTANGDIDTAVLKSFLNARSGFVVTWYDQSGNARNATQATQANQPRIANLGVIDRIGGKIVIRAASTNTLTTSVDINNLTFTTFISLSRSGTGNDAILLKDNFNYMYLQYGTTTYIGDATITGITVNTNQTLITLRRSPSNPQISSVYRNNVFQNSTTNVAANTAFTRIPSNTLRSSTVFLNELVVYYSDQINNISAINTNINNYWSIY